MIERRKHKRYKVKNGVVAVLTPRHSRLFILEDISLGGFRGRYLKNDKDHGDRPEGISLFDLEGEEKVSDLNCRTVSDTVFRPELSFLPMPMRRHRVAFEALTPQQEKQLVSFINTHALLGGEAA